MRSIVFFIPFLLLNHSLRSQLPGAGLLAHYPFTGNANDNTANNVNGTLFGATLTSDRFGNSNSAYFFNGTSNYIELPPALFTSLNIYSYSFWIKPATATTGIPFCIGESSNGYCQAITFTPNSTLAATGYNQGAPLQSAIYSNPISLNQWHHVVMTRDLVSIKLYVDGLQVIPIPLANTNGLNASYGTNLPLRAYIGARTTNTSFFNGAIDDVRIYSLALNASNVTALYNENCLVSPISISVQICSGNTATLNASSTYSSSPNIVWYNSPSSTTVITNGNTLVTPPLFVTGTYSYYVNELNCADPPHLVSVNVNPNPTVAVNSGSICVGETFTLVPQGANSYTVSGGSYTVSPAFTTTYSVTGTSSLGCLSVNSAISTITVVSTIISASSTQSSICSGQTAVLSASGGITYTWSTGANTSSIVISPNITTNYTVNGSNNGCKGSFVLSQNVSPCLGLNYPNSNKLLLSIYPNPSNGIFTLKLPDQFELPYKVFLEDPSGRSISNFKIKQENTGFSLEFENAAPGVYIIRLISEYGQVSTSRLLIAD